MTPAAARLGDLRGGLLVTVLVGSPVVFWRSTLDVFGVIKLTLGLWAVVAVAVLTVVRWVIDGEVRLSRSNFVALAAGFLAVFAVVALAGDVQAGHAAWGVHGRWTGWLAYATYVALGITAMRHATPRMVRTLVVATSVATVVVATYGVLQRLGLDPFGWSDDGTPRYFSTLGNVNFAAAYLGLATPPALWLGLHGGSGWERRTGWAAGVLGVAGVVAIPSLQGPVVLAIGLAGLAVAELLARSQAARSFVSAHSRALTAAAALIVAAGIAALVATWSRLLPMLGIGFQERLYFYEASLEMSRDRPLLGSGPDSFGVLFSRYQPVAHALEFPTAVPDQPHSVPLAMFVHGGVLLGLVYVAVVVYVAFLIVRGLRRSGPAAFDGLVPLALLWVGYQVQSLISMDEVPLAALHWIVAGTIAGLVAPDVTQRINLPWGPTLNKRGERRYRRTALPLAGRVAVVAVSLAGVVAVWLVSVPLRADLAAGEAASLARGVAVEPRQYDMAVDAFERPQALAPWVWRYHALEAELHAAQDQPEEALDAFARTAELAAGYSYYPFQAGLTAGQLERPEEADEWIALAVERDPQNPDILERAARHFEAVGDSQRATELAERAQALRDAYAGGS